MYLTEGIYRFRLRSHGSGRGRWCAGSLVASSLDGSVVFLPCFNKYIMGFCSELWLS